MQKCKVIVMAVAILLSAGKLLSQGKNKQLDSLLQTLHKQGKFDGAILVADNHGVKYENGFGNARLKPGIPNKVNSVFCIASLSKPFTSLLVLQLVQKGTIKLDDKLDSFLPRLKNENIRKVTIHQLLSHTSGIPDFIDGTATEKNYTDSWFTRKLDSLPPIAGSEKKFRYVSSTYVLLAHIIEKVTGQSYAENLTQNILKPSGMHHTGAIVSGLKLQNMAEGHVIRDSVITVAFYLNPASFQGAGSIYSTVGDLYKFDQVLYSDKLIGAKYKEMMFTIQSDASYGYGWAVPEMPAGRVVMHEGDFPGYTSLLFRAIEKKYCIAMLGNNQSQSKYKTEILQLIVHVLHEADTN